MSDNHIGPSESERPASVASGGSSFPLVTAFDLGASLHRSSWNQRLAVLLGSDTHARAADAALEDLGVIALRCGSSVQAAVAVQQEAADVASTWQRWFASEAFQMEWEAIRQEAEVDVERWRRSGEPGELSDVVENAFWLLLKGLDEWTNRIRNAALATLAGEGARTAFHLGERVDQGIRPADAWRTAYSLLPAEPPPGEAALNPFDIVDATAGKSPTVNPSLTARSVEPGQRPLPPRWLEQITALFARLTPPGGAPLPTAPPPDSALAADRMKFVEAVENALRLGLATLDQLPINGWPPDTARALPEAMAGGPAKPLSQGAATAYRAYQVAIQELPEKATDREVHRHIQRHKPAGYDLPEVDTVCRSLRQARQHYGTQKVTSRYGRTGRSIVPNEDL